MATEVRAEATASKTVTTIRRWRRTDQATERWWPWGIIPLLGLLLLLLFAVAIFAPVSVESDVARQAEARLKEAGYSWVEVAADGQRVIVRGTSPTPVAEATLAALTKTTECETTFGRHQCPTDVSVDVQFAPTPPPVPAVVPSVRAHAFEFERFSGRVVLRGEVPNEETRRRLVAAARREFSDVVDELRITNEHPKGPYDEASKGALQIVAFLVSGKAGYAGQRLGVNGVVAEGRRGDVERILAGLGADNQGSVTLLEERQATECDEAFAGRLSRSKIQFATASAVVRQGSMPLLEALAEIARKCPVTLQIEGHTDDVGTDESNEMLSRNRAASVRRILNDLGIEDDRLVALGFGERRPIASNSTRIGKAKNRRIEIKIRR